MAEKFDYVGIRADAVELINEFGFQMSIEKPGGGSKQNFVGVLLDLTAKDRSNSLLVGSTNRVLTSDALKRDVTDDGDYVTIQNTKYVVVSSELLKPGGLDVLWTLFLRK